MHYRDHTRLSRVLLSQQRALGVVEKCRRAEGNHQVVVQIRLDASIAEIRESAQISIVSREAVPYFQDMMANTVLAEHILRTAVIYIDDVLVASG